MKNIVLLLCLGSLFTFLRAQGNLQFNRTIYRTFDAVYAGSTIPWVGGLPPTNLTIISKDTIILTISSGKTFKLEKALANVSTGALNCTSPTFFGQPDFIVGGSINQNVYMNGINISSSTTNNFPIWLSEGTYIFTSVYTNHSGGTCSNTFPFTHVYPPSILSGFISGIEFNIIP